MINLSQASPLLNNTVWALKFVILAFWATFSTWIYVNCESISLFPKLHRIMLLKMMIYTLSPKILVKLSRPSDRHFTSDSAFTDAPLVELMYRAYSLNLKSMSTQNYLEDPSFVRSYHLSKYSLNHSWSHNKNQLDHPHSRWRHPYRIWLWSTYLQLSPSVETS